MQRIRTKIEVNGTSQEAWKPGGKSIKGAMPGPWVGEICKMTVIILINGLTFPLLLYVAVSGGG